MSNKKIDNVPTLEQFKKIVQSKFDVYKKKGYKLGQAYNIEAKKYGFTNWHHMCSTLKNKEKVKDTGSLTKEQLQKLKNILSPEDSTEINHKLKFGKENE